MPHQPLATAYDEDWTGQPVPCSADMHRGLKEYVMVRSELVRKVSEASPHLSPQAVEAAIDAILKEVEKTLGCGHRVELRGFGSFFTRPRHARIGRNPKNGVAVSVAAKEILRFRASRQLLERINGPR